MTELFRSDGVVHVAMEYQAKEERAGAGPARGAARKRAQKECKIRPQNTHHSGRSIVVRSRRAPRIRRGGRRGASAVLRPTSAAGPPGAGGMGGRCFRLPKLQRLRQGYASV